MRSNPGIIELGTTVAVVGIVGFVGLKMLDVLNHLNLNPFAGIPNAAGQGAAGGLYSAGASIGNAVNTATKGYIDEVALQNAVTYWRRPGFEVRNWVPGLYGPDNPNSWDDFKTWYAANGSNYALAQGLTIPSSAPSWFYDPGYAGGPTH